MRRCAGTLEGWLSYIALSALLQQSERRAGYHSADLRHAHEYSRLGLNTGLEQ
jgi:hypothetical protein